VIFTKSIKHHVSMGNYEWIELAASVTVDTQDQPLNAGFIATAADQLEALLADDLADARETTLEKKSYIRRMYEE
jgi:hypothetical protein